MEQIDASAMAAIGEADVLSPIIDRYRADAISHLCAWHTLTGSFIDLLARDPLDMPALKAVGAACDRSREAAGAALMGLGAAWGSQGVA